MKWSLLLFALAAACSNEGARPAPPERGEQLRVYAVNYPLRYFAESMGGDAVEVAFPAPAGVDPAFWEPDDEVVALYQQADVILLNGAGYARWVSLVSLPPSRLVDTSAAFSDHLIEATDVTTHSHGPEGAHEHGNVAFTTWLDLAQAQEQAAAVRDALIRAAPDRRSAFEQAFEALAGKLEDLDNAMAEAASTEPVVGSHPVYQYWARRYEVDLVSVHFEPDEFPSKAGWAELDQVLATHPAKLMLWEAQPLPETVARLEQLGLRCVVLEPCGNAPSSGDFLDIMRANVERLR